MPDFPLQMLTLNSGKVLFWNQLLSCESILPHSVVTFSSCALQERIKIPEDKMVYYENLAEMYVGDDVSPDFYGWVFPKCDHVAVGTGTVINKPAIKKYQTAIRNRAKDKIAGKDRLHPPLTLPSDRPLTN